MVTTRKHLEALREADQRALAIKERADEKALSLAREIQTYKDEKANELRSQIERERGEMATKDDLAAAIEKVEAVRVSNVFNARTLLVALLAIAASILVGADAFG